METDDTTTTGDKGAGNRIRLHLKLSLTDGRHRVFFGPGVMELLQDIRETGSIQQAARKMGLSYVKALKILRQTEEGFGRPFLLRRKGGNERGKSVLTPFGACFLDRCEAFWADAEKNLSEQFAALLAEDFPGDIPDGSQP